VASGVVSGDEAVAVRMASAAHIAPGLPGEMVNDRAIEAITVTPGKPGAIWQRAAAVGELRDHGRPHLR
jgi:hypothetical protein